MAWKKVITVGVVGVGRGRNFAHAATEALGLKLVALCDTWQERLEQAGKQYGVATYTDYEQFLSHDMDAVVLANYFHEHTPLAIKALAAGKHVLSETACNSTLAEGVALCRAVEKSSKVYMLAENYPYTAFNMEMRRLYASGEIGRVTYAEGEYNHPMSADFANSIAPGEGHWRNWLPSTYYCTHALAPLVCITGELPVKINALGIAAPEVNRKTAHVSDPGAVILCRTESGAVFRLFGLVMPGHSNWYRVHGTRGAMELVRSSDYFGTGEVRVWHEEWNCPRGKPKQRIYKPDWSSHKRLAAAAGHGGGDFWVSYEFARAIRTLTPPLLDVYRGVTMSSVGILAWKSALADGAPVDMPDFRKESSRKKYADDHWSPWPKDKTAAPHQPPASILGKLKPSASDMAYARKVWGRIGYKSKRGLGENR